MVDVWDAAFSVETVICRHLGNQISKARFLMVYWYIEQLETSYIHR